MMRAPLKPEALHLLLLMQRENQLTQYLLCTGKSR